ncbi:MAG: GAF domain-containing protein [Acidobacteria bacterium]|nr:GAF domain-containing protein [Acidobacteriota bacterium]
MSDRTRGTLTEPSADRAARYERIASQLEDLFRKTTDREARMATAAAVLHHKMPHFFWTGFYRLVGEDLVVGPYQGPLACAVLPRRTGVCWAALAEGRTIVVPDVHTFPGHVACDSRSRSEVALPVPVPGGAPAGVLDVDSDKPAAFTEADARGLEAVAALIYQP